MLTHITNRSTKTSSFKKCLATSLLLTAVSGSAMADPATQADPAPQAGSSGLFERVYVPTLGGAGNGGNVPPA